MKDVSDDKLNPKKKRKDRKVEGKNAVSKMRVRIYLNFGVSYIRERVISVHNLLALI